jgi:hypothetical protein
MTSESELRDKLRKIEALFAGAGTAGEKAAAGAAAERIKSRLKNAEKSEKSIETKFSIPDRWSRQLFSALCRRYGLKPFRYRRQHHQTIMVKAPTSFVEGVLWPEFKELDAALVAYLTDITDRLIREEVHKEASEADVVPDPTRIGP